MNRIAIIGPTGVGKTTTALLVARRWGIPRISLDETRHIFLRETGFDEKRSNELKRQDFEAAIRYWEEFNPHVVQRTLEANSIGVFDFGAIHSVYDDPARLERVANLLKALDDVVCLLPCADQARSLEVLIARGREPGMSDSTLEMWRRIIGRFISHSSNSRLARRFIYTDGRTPEMVCEEIVKQ